MDRERFARVRELFEQAEALPPSDRRAFLQEQCRDDEALLLEVESLLESDAEAASFLSEPPLGKRNALQPPPDVARSPDEPERPERLGDFRIRGEIGRGGMGIVYDADQLSLGRRVALKVLPSHWLLRPDAVERFRREAKTAAALDHPGIVEIHSVGESDGALYFSMERVDGIALDRLISAAREHEGQSSRAVIVAAFDREEPPGSWAEAPWIEIVCRLVIQVARALEHAHRAGVLHRDVKPSNVLLRPDGTTVLTDFGLARLDSQPALTRTGQLAGTPEYLSPEQADGRPASSRSDLFSLGVVMYELLTLERPFQGENTAQILARVSTREAVPLRKLDPQIPRDLETVVSTLLEKDPARRYPDAGELAADLERFLEYRPILARPVSPVTRMTRWVRRNAWATAAVSLPILLTIGGLAAFAIYQVGMNETIRSERDQAELRKREAEAATIEARRANAELALESGRLAAQQGDWTEALAAYELALESGHPDEVGVRLAMIQAWEGSFETRRARAAIDALARREELGDHAPRIWLTQGILRVYEPAEHEEGRALLQRALDSKKLSAADQAIAHGLLAEDLYVQKRFLELALVKDPSSHRAYTALGNLLPVLGLFDEAEVLAARFRARYPDDPVALHLEAVCEFIEAEGASRGDRIIARFERAKRPDVAEFLRTYRTVVAMGAELDSLMLRDVLSLPWPGEVTRPSEASKAVASLALVGQALGWLQKIEDDRSRISGANVLVAIPPPLKQDVLAATTSTIVALAAPNPSRLTTALDGLDQVLQQYPVGIIRFFRGLMALGLERFDEAEADLLQAAQEPSPVRVVRAPLLLALYLQVCDYAESEEGERSAAARRAADSVWQILGRSDVSVGELELLARAARFTNDLELASGIASRWRQRHPSDPDVWIALSKIALQRDDRAAAQRHARRALQIDPRHAAALAWLDELASRQEED